MASGEVAGLDEASWDRFRIDLIDAGFEPAVAGSLRCWRGPIAQPLKAITGAEDMIVAFRDGWPHRPPKLFVVDDHLVSEHVSAKGEICLWGPDDSSGQWMTFAGFQRRISDWAAQQAEGFRAADAMLDAHLYFEPTSTVLATLDLSTLNVGPNDIEANNRLYGKWDRDKTRLALATTRLSGKTLDGRWYYVKDGPAAPPRNLDAVRAALTTEQRTALDQRLKRLNKSGPQVIALLWDTPHGRNALVVLIIPQTGGGMHAEALELAPCDLQTLQLRCGPDARLLQDRMVTVFGAGAIGSNVAVRLAEAGLGRLRLIDGDRLRPGNIVRHATEHGIGSSKAQATAVKVQSRAAWTTVEDIAETPWNPERVAELMRDGDAVIDATGLGPFGDLISRLATQHHQTLVSAALYRAGAVGRVRRQIPGSDLPIYARTDERRFPIIPAGDEPLALEAGCSARVNNASPVAVAAVAALTAEITIDLLSERLLHAAETIEVYRPLDTAPFDRLGRVSHA